MESKTFRGDFFKILDKFKSRESFAFLRFSDGELRLLQGKELVLAANYNKIGKRVRKSHYVEEDFKNVNPTDHPHVYKKLLEAYLHKQHNYYVGLSCRCCVGNRDFKWMVNLYGGEDEFLTWSNLVVNANYPLFRQHFIPELQKRRVVFVLNKSADLSGLPFKVVKDFRIGTNCIVNDFDKWEEVGDWIREYSVHDHVFLFSASSLSNIMTYELYKRYPYNTYMDIGTTFNQDMNMKSVRSYQVGGKYAKKVCVW